MRQQRSLAPTLVVLVACLAGPGAARAVDGVIEINDARAVAGGVTPGDTPGYPVTIGQTGSYRLTGDLGVTGANIDVIEITADDVTLDLNGFTIRCIWFGTPCAGNGTGVGVDAAAVSNVTVRNGTVRDMAAAAIDIGQYGLVEKVRAIANGTGILVTDGVVESCLAADNLDDGIGASQTLVRNSWTHGNATGIECGSGTSTACTLHGNDISGNSVGEVGGAIISTGANRRCNSSHVACTLF